MGDAIVRKETDIRTLGEKIKSLDAEIKYQGDGSKAVIISPNSRMSALKCGILMKNKLFVNNFIIVIS